MYTYIYACATAQPDSRLGDTVEIRDAVTAYQVHKAVPMSVHITTFIVRM